MKLSPGKRKRNIHSRDMQDFEKLGVFYLGRPYDVNSKTPKEGLLLYNSKDLLTQCSEGKGSRVRERLLVK